MSLRKRIKQAMIKLSEQFKNIKIEKKDNFFILYKKFGFDWVVMIRIEDGVDRFLTYERIYSFEEFKRLKFNDEFRLSLGSRFEIYSLEIMDLLQKTVVSNTVSNPVVKKAR